MILERADIHPALTMSALLTEAILMCSLTMCGTSFSSFCWIYQEILEKNSCYRDNFTLIFSVYFIILLLFKGFLEQYTS